MVVTLSFVVLTCTVSIVYPSVSTVLSILGGLCSVSICYTVPLYSWVKLSDKKWTAMENLAPMMFFIPLIMIGYLSVFSTVYMLAMGKSYLGDRTDIICKQ